MRYSIVLRNYDMINFLKYIVYIFIVVVTILSFPHYGKKLIQYVLALEAYNL